MVIWNENVTFALFLNIRDMKFSEFYRLLEENGWSLDKGKGAKHARYVKEGVTHFIPVGRHPAKEVPTGTLNKMKKDAGID